MRNQQFQMSEDAVFAWKSDWVQRQKNISLHSDVFWKEVVDMLLAGRQTMNNNPLVPIGRYVFEWKGAMEYLVGRNNRGIDFEKNGDIESAVLIFEVSIADEFFGTHPYDRLRIIYGKQKKYKDAIRVCKAYLNLPNRPNGQNKPHFQQHLEKLWALQNKSKIT